MRYLLPIAAALLLLSSPAAAAPQVLGLMASNGPVPLNCDERDCSAIVPSFCLQRERAMPSYGTAYEPTHPEQLTLALTTADGTVRRLPAAAHLRFAGFDGYTTVRISLPRAVLADSGATAAVIEIGPGIALLPVAKAGDEDPQSADEIALAAGPMRLAAARYLDTPTVEGDAARLVAALMTALPRQSTLHDDHLRLWQTTIGRDVAARVEPAALDRARSVFERCAATSYFRGCLLSRQREIMEAGNLRFWDETSGY
jgi:hypothetical protein